jgi:hypothetical protein
MRWLFAGSLLLGMLALIALMLQQGLRRGGGPISRPARWIVAGAVAFGMGGLSAAYAGWHLAPASLAAVAAGAVAAWLAGGTGRRGGPGPD